VKNVAMHLMRNGEHSGATLAPAAKRLKVAVTPNSGVPGSESVTVQSSGSKDSAGVAKKRAWVRREPAKNAKVVEFTLRVMPNGELSGAIPEPPARRLKMAVTPKYAAMPASGSMAAQSEGNVAKKRVWEDTEPVENAIEAEPVEMKIKEEDVEKSPLEETSLDQVCEPAAVLEKKSGLGLEPANSRASNAAKYQVSVTAVAKDREQPAQVFKEPPPAKTRSAILIRVTSASESKTPELGGARPVALTTKSEVTAPKAAPKCKVAVGPSPPFVGKGVVANVPPLRAKSLNATSKGAVATPKCKVAVTTATPKCKVAVTTATRKCKVAVTPPSSAVRCKVEAVTPPVASPPRHTRTASNSPPKRELPPRGAAATRPSPQRTQRTTTSSPTSKKRCWN